MKRGKRHDQKSKGSDTNFLLQQAIDFSLCMHAFFFPSFQTHKSDQCRNTYRLRPLVGPLIKLNESKFKTIKEIIYMGLDLIGDNYLTHQPIPMVYIQTFNIITCNLLGIKTQKKKKIECFLEIKVQGFFLRFATHANLKFQNH